MATTPIGKLIRVQRKKLELSQVQLGRKANLDPTFISRIERGATGIGLKHAGKLASALQVDTEDVVRAIAETESKDLDVSAYANVLKQEPTQGDTVPVIGLVSTDRPTLESLPNEVIEVPHTLLAADANIVAVRVRGEGYAPAFEDGDTVVISPSRSYFPNDPVLIRTKDNRAFLGRITFEGDQIAIIPFQPKQPKTKLAKGDVVSISRVVLRYLV